MLVKPASPISSLPPAAPRPAALVDGTWAAARLDAGELGPSLLELVMWFPGGDAALGATGPVATVTMDREAAHALLPALPATGELVSITGPTYPPSLFEGAGYFGARAIRIDGGVLVAVRVGG